MAPDVADASDAAARGRPSPAATVGLILPGGGARAAYQVGALKAIAELLPNSPNPFPVIVGTSAGAVAAAVLASGAFRWRRAVAALEQVWGAFHVHHVFRVDALSTLRAGSHWLLSLLSGGTLVKPPQALFDNAPLRELLTRSIEWDNLRRSIERRDLRALALCASNYTTGASLAFFQGASDIPAWVRQQRVGRRTQLTLDHVMASLAVPFLFPPVRLPDGYYGDGAQRQLWPLSPAIHLGADRLLIVGVNDPINLGARPKVPAIEPSFGQIIGFMLDSLFMDQLHADLERINRYNENSEFRHIDSLVLIPSRDVNEIARRHAHELPRSLRILLRTLGANNAASTLLLSYLLFERGFTRELIAMGYEDARAHADQIRGFLALSAARRHRAPED